MKQQNIQFAGVLTLGLVVGILIAFTFLDSSSSVSNSYYDSYDFENDGAIQFYSYESFSQFLQLESGTLPSSGKNSFLRAGGISEAAFDSSAPTSIQGSDDGGSGSFYSETNVQVSGVDEPDIVKTDGEYIYTVTKNRVVITDAQPVDNLEVVSVIDFSSRKEMDNLVDSRIMSTPRDSSSVHNLFLSDDKLIVFLSSYSYEPYTSVRCLGNDYCGGKSESRSEVLVYDVSDVSSPELVQTISTDGNYVDARMVNDMVYFVSNKYINTQNPEFPIYYINDEARVLSLDDVYYLGDRDESYQFSSVGALDTSSLDFEVSSYVVGTTGTIYMSDSDLYLTGTKTRDYYEYQLEMIDSAILPILPVQVSFDVENILSGDGYDYVKIDDVGARIEEYYLTLSDSDKDSFEDELLSSIKDFKKETAKDYTQTVIHKISVSGLSISHEATGTVPGRLHNQFSMDESGDYFRIATTTRGSFVFDGERLESLNHVYVLDSNLDVVGSLEDLASGEQIYSARFMGDRLYLVTFRQIDPLFVIDLSNPSDPSVLGELKITGVSDYLHPYGEDYILGVGRDADVDGRIKGLKISLFDVSDVSSPKEVDTYYIGESGSSSAALYDPHAILFDEEKELLVLPVREVSDDYRSSKSLAYVLTVSSDKISLRGTINHEISKDSDNPYYYYNYNAIERSLYIDFVLYTISPEMIKAHDLDSLEILNSLSFGFSDEVYPVYYGAPDIEVREDMAFSVMAVSSEPEQL